MAPNLTTGAIKRVLAGELPEKMVLQILAVRKFPNGDRHRLFLSDGVHKSSIAVLSTRLTGSVENGEIGVNSVIRIDKYLSNDTAKKKVLIILEAALLEDGATVGGIIGHPTHCENTVSGSSNGNQAPVTSTPRTPMVAQPSFAPGAIKRPREEQEIPDGMPKSIRLISSLNPYQNKWTICGRVTSKGNLRTYKNARGEGKVFSFDLLDESGEIRATCFNDEADKFYALIEPNKVYFLSTATIKTANKQYSKLDNDYEMTLNSNSQISLCQDDVGVPTMQFNFVSINQLENAAKNSTFDIIGVCNSVADVSSVTKKTTGEELKKREISVVDTSNTSVSITLWGQQGENFDGSSNPVIALKNGVVSDFNGVSLSCYSSSIMQIDPDITEAHQLKGWWETTGCQVQSFNSLSGTRSVTTGMGNTPFKTFEEAREEKLGTKDSFDYYAVKGTVVLVRKENILYMSCPGEKCLKKVTDMSNGLYRCEKCNRDYENFNWRMMGSCNLADFTGDVWASMFQEIGEQVLGMTANELALQKQEDEAKFLASMHDAAFKEYNFKLRAKMETYNDESRIKTQIFAVTPVDHTEYAKRLVKEIKQMACVA